VRCGGSDGNRCLVVQSRCLDTPANRSQLAICRRFPASPERENASALGIAAALAATLPVHVLLILSGAVAALVLPVYIGIALPAVWSAKPARRKAAAAVLQQILDARTGATGRRRY
jgi:hypothetical protein